MIFVLLTQESLLNASMGKFQSVNFQETMQPSFLCDDCLSKYSARRNLTRHIKKFHLVLGNTSPRVPLACDDCSAKLSCKSNLGRHTLETIHWGHIRRETKAKTTLQCDDCCSTISAKGHLKQHIVRRHLSVGADLQLRCDVCSTSYREKAVVVRHLQHVHKVVVGLADLECDVCGLSATVRKAGFAAHIYSHPRFHLDHWRCDYCASQFSAKSSLPKHINVAHMKKNQLWKWQCDSCQMTTQFYQKSNLVSHVIHRHLETTPSLKCDHCNLLVTTKGGLIRHLHVHSLNRWIWRCNRCPTAQFVKKKSLERYLTKLRCRDNLND